MIVPKSDIRSNTVNSPFKILESSRGSLFVVVIVFSLVLMSTGYYMLARYLEYNKSAVNIKKYLTQEIILDSLLNYTILGVNAQWCFSDAWANDSASCDLSHKKNTYRLLITDDSILATEILIQNSTAAEPPPVHESIGGQPTLRINEIILNVPLNVMTSNHPLRRILAPISDNYESIDFEIKRIDSEDYPSIGSATHLGISILLNKKSGKDVPNYQIKSNLVVYPRELNNFAFVVANDLRLDGVSRSTPKGDAVVEKFGSLTSPIQSGLFFYSPVFINNDLHLPDTGQFNRVVFADKVILGSGGIKQNGEYLNSNASGAPSKKYLSDLKEIGGFLGGVTYDETGDLGLEYLSGNKTDGFVITSDLKKDRKLCLSQLAASFDLMATKKSVLLQKRVDSGTSLNTHWFTQRLSLTHKNEFVPQVNDSGTIIGHNLVGNIAGDFFVPPALNSPPPVEGVIIEVIATITTTNKELIVTGQLSRDSILTLQPKVLDVTPLTTKIGELENQIIELEGRKTACVATETVTVDECKSAIDLIIAPVSLELNKRKEYLIEVNGDETAENTSPENPPTITVSVIPFRIGSSIQDGTINFKIEGQNLKHLGAELNADLESVNTGNTEIQIEVRAFEVGTINTADIRNYNDNNGNGNNGNGNNDDDDDDKKYTGDNDFDRTGKYVGGTGGIIGINDGKFTNLSTGSDYIVVSKAPDYYNSYLNNDDDDDEDNDNDHKNDDNKDYKKHKQKCNGFDEDDDNIYAFDSLSATHDFSKRTMDSWSFVKACNGKDITLGTAPAGVASVVGAANANINGITNGVGLGGGQPDENAFVFNDDSFQVCSLAKSCTIKSTTNFVSGFYACEEFIIEGGRTAPLRIIGTIIAGKATIKSNALANGIYWSSINNSASVYELREKGILKSKILGKSCDSLDPIWDPNIELSDKFSNYFCNTISLRGLAQPLQWTTIDPDCGLIVGPLDASGNPTTPDNVACKRLPRKFTIKELGRQSGVAY